MGHPDPQSVRITDVSPRDGLQNESGVIPTADKIRLVDLLRKTGVDEIEVSSFVSAKWVPQLGDAAEVFAGLAAEVGRATAAPTPTPPSGRGSGGRGAGRTGSGGTRPRVLFSALVPNEKGLDGALAVNAAAGGPLIGKVSVFTAASETFSKRNTNASIAQALERFQPVIQTAHAHGLLVRGYVSCVIACPFEGPIAPANVISVAQRLIDLGVDELDYGDTIGAGTPESVRALLAAHRDALDEEEWLDEERFTLHLHDTFGRAAACVTEALSMGVRSFDASVAGLGGCPYASTPGKPAPGNISTETLVRAVEAAGFATGVDLEALREAATFARSIVAASRAGAGGRP